MSWKSLKHNEQILEYLGEEQEPQHIGSGVYAKVYWLKKDRKKIIKITESKSDALACMALIHHPKKHMLRVFDVFRIDATKGLYGIVAEKCTPLSRSEIMVFDELVVLEEESPRPLAENEDGLSLEWVDWFTSYLEKLQVTVDKKIFKNYYTWAKELKDLDVIFWDLHSGNVMKRGNLSVIVDLGGGSTPIFDIPDLSDF